MFEMGQKMVCFGLVGLEQGRTECGFGVLLVEVTEEDFLMEIIS